MAFSNLTKSTPINISGLAYDDFVGYYTVTATGTLSTTLSQSNSGALSGKWSFGGSVTTVPNFTNPPGFKTKTTTINEQGNVGPNGLNGYGFYGGTYFSGTGILNGAGTDLAVIATVWGNTDLSTLGVTSTVHVGLVPTVNHIHLNVVFGAGSYGTVEAYKDDQLQVFNGVSKANVAFDDLMPVPGNDYTVRFRHSSKNGDVLQFDEKSFAKLDRNSIQIHGGNSPGDSEGCIVLGDNIVNGVSNNGYWSGLKKLLNDIATAENASADANGFVTFKNPVTVNVSGLTTQPWLELKAANTAPKRGQSDVFTFTLNGLSPAAPIVDKDVKIFFSVKGAPQDQLLQLLSGAAWVKDQGLFQTTILGRHDHTYASVAPVTAPTATVTLNTVGLKASDLTFSIDHYELTRWSTSGSITDFIPSGSSDPSKIQFSNQPLMHTPSTASITTTISIKDPNFTGATQIQNGAAFVPQTEAYYQEFATMLRDGVADTGLRWLGPAVHNSLLKLGPSDAAWSTVGWNQIGAGAAQQSVQIATFLGVLPSLLDAANHAMQQVQTSTVTLDSQKDLVKLSAALATSLAGEMIVTNAAVLAVGLGASTTVAAGVGMAAPVLVGMVLVGTGLYVVDFLNNKKAIVEAVQAVGPSGVVKQFASDQGKAIPSSSMAPTVDGSGAESGDLTSPVTYGTNLSSLGLTLGSEAPAPSWRYNVETGVFTWLAASTAALDRALTQIGANQFAVPLTIAGDNTGNIITGGPLADTLTGGSGNDTIIGAGGNDQLNGSGGDDLIVPGSGSTTIDGGTGVNTVNYMAATAAISALLSTNKVNKIGGAVDTLANIQKIVGSTANDTFLSGSGSHTLDGGGGSDTLDYTGSATAVNVNLLTGVVANNGFNAQDTIANFQNATTTTSGSVLKAGATGGTLKATGNFNTLTGQTSDTLVVVGSGNMLISGSGSSTLNATGGSNKLTGGAGNDTLSVSGGASNTLNGGTGSNTLDYQGWSSNVTLNLKTSQATNASGTDTFSNLQSFMLGAGNDTVIAGTGAHTLNGGGGSNTLDFSGASVSVNVNLLSGLVANNGYNAQDTVANFQNAIATFGGSILKAGAIGGTLKAIGNFNTLTGQTSDTLISVGSGNTLTAGSGSSTLNSTGGSNKLTGGAGNDTLSVSAGASNTLDGGSGFNTLDYQGWGSGVTLNLKTNQAINASGIDTLSNLQGFLLGGGNDVVIAGPGAHALNGGGGSNTLDFSGATATVNVNLLTGLVANNGYNAQDTVANFQNVTVTASGSVLKAGAAGGTLKATGNFYTLTGHTSDTLIVVGSGNVLTAGSGSSTINATGGSNKLIGSSGNDTLSVSGGASNTLNGGTGFNTLDYQGWGSGVTLNLKTNQATNASGSDSFSNIQSFLLGAGSDVVIAGAGPHTLNGGGGGNTLDFTGAATAVNVNLLTGVVANNGYNAQDTVTNFQTVVTNVSGSVLRAGAAGSVLKATGNFSTLIGQTSDTLISIGSGNTLTAGSGGSTLNATGGSNKLTGGAGNDTLSVSGGGSNVIDGGSGFNTLDYQGWGGVDVTVNLKTGQTINASGADTFSNIQNFVLGGGNDTVLAGAGTHALNGGGGSNILDFTGATVGVNVNLLSGIVANNGYGAIDTVLNFQNVIATTAGSVLKAGAVGGTLKATGNFNSLTGQTSDTLIVVGSGNTLTAGGGSSTLNATGGSNKLTGGAGNDMLSISGGASNQLDGGAGFNTLDYQGWSANILLNLKTGQLSNGAGADSFVNLQGFLLGGGNDTVFGGAGDHTLNGGGGTNTLFYANNGSTVNVNLLSGVVANNGFGARDTVSNFQNLQVTGDGAVMRAGAAAGALTLTGNFGAMTGQTSDTLQATGDRNALTAGSGNSVLKAVGSSNILKGGAGNDTLTTSGGHFNLLDGGAGSSTITATGDWNQLIAGNGGSLLAATGSWNLLASGAGNDTLTVGGDHNTLQAGAGNDTLTVTKGHFNALDGGAGSSTITVTGDWNVLTAGNLGSLLAATGNWNTLNGGGGGDNLMAGGGNSNTLNGGAGDDAITVTGGNFNTLNGGAGHDTLSALGDWNMLNAGNDGSSLFASGNWNTLTGGSGNDTFLAVGGASNKMVGGAGIDTLDYSGLGVAVTLNLKTGTVNNGADSFSGIESFKLGGGNDTVTGGPGSHTIAAGGGTDTLVYANNGSTVNANLLSGVVANNGSNDVDTVSGFENLTVSGDGAVMRAGAAAGVLTLTGHFGTMTGQTADTLKATGDRNVLTAGSGNSVLSDTGSFNKLTGGSGNDTLTVIGHFNALDGGGGSSTLTATGDWNVLLVGNGGSLLAATGNWNTLTGGSADDTITAGGGNHNVLKGGAGNDTLTAVGHFNSLDGGSGSSTITATGDWNVLTAGDGGSLLAATGNWNTLKGGSGNDSLVAGGGGSNTLDGGSGNDTLSGGSGKATYVYGDGYGNDVITDFIAASEHFVDLRGVSSFHSTADVLAHASQSGANVVITVGASILTLQDTTFAYLGAHQELLLV